jgi:hypothetical protein
MNASEMMIALEANRNARKSRMPGAQIPWWAKKPPESEAPREDLKGIDSATEDKGVMLGIYCLLANDGSEKLLLTGGRRNDQAGL